MSTIEEKRVYASQTGSREVYVACETGVVVVDVSGAQVGGFSLAHRCAPRDVAAAGDVAVATDEDVQVLSGGAFEPTGFGPAVAVGFDAGSLLAATADGSIERLEPGPDGFEPSGDGVEPSDDGFEHPHDWTRVGTVDADVRAIDGALVATSEGVYRAGDPGTGDGAGSGASAGAVLTPVGLDDVRDVAAAGVPLAATAAGLFRLGNGWMALVDGDFRVVASDPDGGRAHAATPEAVYAADGSDGAGADWAPVDLPVAPTTDGPVRGLGYTQAATVAVTENGTLLVGGGGRETGLADGDGPDADTAWRSQALGVEGVVGLAVR